MFLSNGTLKEIKSVFKVKTITKHIVVLKGLGIEDQDGLTEDATMGHAAAVASRGSSWG